MQFISGKNYRKSVGKLNPSSFFASNIIRCEYHTVNGVRPYGYFPV